MLSQHFQTFGRYNRWANQRLYAAAAELTEEQYRADGGAFFRSVHGTLNHVLVADRIWRGRITGESAAHVQLDEIVCERLADLRAEREREDEWIELYTRGLDDACLSAQISYRRVSSPEQMRQSLASVLAHFFNHQTHHRGQAHGLLTALTGAAPELDLLYFQRAAGLP